MRCELLERITTLKAPELATAISRAPPLTPGSAELHTPPTRLLELLACLGSILVEAGCRAQKRDRLAQMTLIHRARFREPVTPGTELVVEAHGVALATDAGRVRTELRNGTLLLAEAELTFRLTEVTDALTRERLAAELEALLRGR